MNTTRALALLVCVAAAVSSGCKTGPGSFRDKFGVDPIDAQVTDFWWSGFGMDHAYLWVLEPADDRFVGAVVRSAQLAPPRSELETDGPGQGRPTPPWWDSRTIEALPERYVRNGAGQYWRVWVDRRSNRIYAFWYDV